MFTYEGLGGPLDLVFGLPLHPLLVHASIVLVPLVSIAAIFIAFSPDFFRRYGRLTLIFAIVTQLSLVLAKSSGEAFQERLGVEIQRHAQLGQIAPLTFAPLLAVLVFRWWLERTNSNIGSTKRWLSLLLVATSLMALTFIVLTGHSGAESVWGWVKDR